MKKRIFGGAAVLFIGALVAAACDDSGAYVVETGDNSDHYCRHFTTCGACTPVEGCGWCQTGVGQGLCAADPDECSSVTAFSWTWDPSGCATAGPGVDAGNVGTVDGGAAAPEDASATPAEDAQTPH